MGNIKKLQFPKDLLGQDDIDGRYGNQFMVIYINENVNSNNPTYVPTTGAPIIKDLNGNPLRTNVSGSVVDAFFSALNGGRIKITETKTTYAIFLPVPLGIKSNFGVEYQEFAAETELLKLAKTGIGTVGKITTEIGKARSLGLMRLGAGIQTALKVVDDASTFGGAILGKSLNPHKELLFKGVNFRKFQFSYKLIANSQEESETIKELINLLRYHMHPNLSLESALFEYPSEFDFEFFIGESNTNGTSQYRRNPYLPFISTCIMTAMDVDVSSNGNYVSFKDSYAPVEYNIKLDLQETQILTKESINKFNQYIDPNSENTGSGR